MRTYRYEACSVADLPPDLNAEAIDGQTTEAVEITIYDETGTRPEAEKAYALYLPEIGRAGIAWGAPAEWLDAGSVDAAIASWLADDENQTDTGTGRRGERDGEAVQHTPGPWRAGIRDNGAPFVETADHEQEIAQLGFEGPIEEGLPNAHLIAAAPALLAALEQIVANAPTEEPDPEDYDDTESAETAGERIAWWEAAEIARAAIRQARGS